MSRRYLYLFLIVILAAALAGASIYALYGQRSPVSNLTFYTEQFPPYNYQENGTITGIAVDLLGEVTSKMGSQIASNQIRLVPWTEGYKATLNGINSVIFSTARLADREASFKWAGPIFTDTYVLFSKWDNEITVNSASDLDGHRIGVIRDSAAITKLTEAGVGESNFVYYTNASVIISDLSSGNIDFWCYAQTVGRTLTEQVTGDYYHFKVAYHLSNYDFYYAFSKDVPDSTVNAFQQAIDALKQEKNAQGVSSYEQILKRYIPTQGTTVSPEELVQFVQAAHTYAQQNGKTAALSEFNNQNGQFIAGELYIFAYDLSGNTLALPFQSDIIGTNRWNLTDPNGVPFIQQIINTAQSGGGFIRYSYADPSDNYSVKPKVSYVMMAGTDWVIGAGIYEAQ
jgi:polar amino acid transport system substrate-binding protein